MAMLNDIQDRVNTQELFRALLGIKSIATKIQQQQQFQFKVANDDVNADNDVNDADENDDQ